VVNSIENVQISEANEAMGAEFTLTANFWANNVDTNVPELAASLSFNDTEFSFSAIVSDMTLAMQIIRVNIDHITENSCSWGKIRTTPDKIAINNAFRALIPTINSKLSTVLVQVPTHLGRYFILSDLVLGYGDEYMSLGLTPTFTKPSAADDIWVIEQ